ncbi:hypothetical protein Dimus_037832 [Dionaea muscipula]
MAIYADSLSMGMGLPLCTYYGEIINAFGISPTQLTPNSWQLMAAFGVLCGHFDCAPNHRMFCKYFKISKNPKDDPWGLHSFSSKAGQVMLSRLSTKVNFFKQRWCWVSGPGIPSNPEWRKPLPVMVVDYFDDEVKLAGQIARLIAKNEPYPVKDLTTRGLLIGAGLVAEDVPEEDTSSKTADTSDAAGPSSPRAASPAHSHDTTDFVFNQLTPNPGASFSPRNLPSPTPFGDSKTGAFSAPRGDEYGELHLDVGYDTIARGIDDPLLPSPEGVNEHASVMEGAFGYHYLVLIYQSFCILVLLFCKLF